MPTHMPTHMPHTHNRHTHTRGSDRESERLGCDGASQPWLNSVGSSKTESVRSSRALRTDALTVVFSSNTRLSGATYDTKSDTAGSGV